MTNLIGMHLIFDSNGAPPLTTTFRESEQNPGGFALSIKDWEQVSHRAMTSFESQGNFSLSTFHRSVVTMSSTTRSNLWTGTGVTTSPPDRLSLPYRNWSRDTRLPSARLIFIPLFHFALISE